MATLGEAIVIIAGDDTGLEQTLRDAEGKTRGWASRVGGALKGAVGGALKGAAIAATGAVVGMGAAFAGAVKGGLDLNSSMEQVHAQLLAFTKDGDLASKILEDIRTEAAKTPFAFEDMAKATAGLLPASKMAGVELMELVKTAEVLAASNPAEGLEGAAFALREAVSGDFTSIIERFNLPRQRINELKEQGVPALEAVRTAMSELGLDASLVSNMAGTMSGRWSTFMDTIDTVKATLAKPLFDVLSEGLAGVQGFLDDNIESINAFAQRVGEGLAGAVQRGADAFGSLFQAAGRGELFTIFEDGSSAIGTFLEKLGVAEPVADRIGGALATVADAAATVADAVGHAIDIISGLARGDAAGGIQALAGLTSLGLSPDAAAGIVETLRSVVDGVTGFVDEVRTAVEEGFAEGGAGGAIQAFIDKLAEISPTVAILQGVFEAALPPIQSIVTTTFGIISGFLEENGESIQNTIGGAWEKIGSIINQIVPPIQSIVQTVFGAVASFLAEHSEEIQGFLGETWQQIAEIISLALAVIEETVVPLLTNIARFIAEHSEEIQGFIEGAWTVISNVIDGALTIIIGLLKVALAVIRGDWDGAWEAIQQTISDVWGNIQGIVDGALQMIANGIKVNTDAMGRFIDEIKGRVSGFLDWLGSLHIPNPFEGLQLPGIPGFQHGGSFVVPPGFEGDRFLMRVSSGERVTVQPAGGGGLAGGIVIQQTFHGPTEPVAVRRAAEEGVRAALRAIGAA